MPLLVLGLVCAAIGAANLRRPVPDGWPWGLSPPAWRRDRERWWRWNMQLSIVLGLAAAVVAVGGMVLA